MPVWAAALAVQAAGTLAASGPTPDVSAAARAKLALHGPWPPVSGPDPNNRLSGRPAAIEFGYRMFREPRMSANGYVACISCHQTDRAFTDGIARAQGLAPVDRNTPALANLRQTHWFGWGGNSDSLWMASLRPMLDSREFGSDAAHVAHVVRVGDGLACRYRRSFGASPLAHADERVMVNVAKAIAAFVETLTTDRTRFDRFRDTLARGTHQANDDYPAAARRGAELFVGKGQCAACHSGPNFTDGAFHAVEHRSGVAAGRADAGREQGLAEWRASPYNQFGRHSDRKARESASRESPRGDAATRGEFRTPSLRNVAVTAPYMHDGSVDTLVEAVGHAARAAPRGAEGVQRPAPLSSRDKTDLAAFLETLTDAQASAREFPPLQASDCPQSGSPTPRAHSGGAEAAPVQASSRSVQAQRSNRVVQ
jgi:cytochrome c peroxidase